MEVKPLIVAELSGNHGGRIDILLNMITAAKECGCDAVKFQLYKPEDMCDPGNNHLYKKFAVPTHWLPDMFGCAEAWDITIFASVFAPWAVDKLEEYDCPAYKIASPESTRLQHYGALVEAINETGKLFIASTGFPDWDLVNSFKPDYLLYCKSGYPTIIGLGDLEFFHRRQFDGFSDHTNNITDPLAFIGAGAKMIEKHFKITEDCIDAAFSLGPPQMKLLCDMAHGRR